MGVEEVTKASNRKNSAHAQVSELRSRSEGKKTQIDIVIRMLLNSIAYQTKIVDDLTHLHSFEGNEFDRMLRLFWRQVTIFDNTFLTALRLENDLLGHKYIPKVDDYQLILDDLNKRAELAEEAQNKLMSTPPQIVYQQIGNKTETKELENKVKELQAAFAYVVPFLRSISELSPGTPLNEDYVNFAQRCIEADVDKIGTPLLKQMETAETERDVAMRALVSNGLAIPVIKGA
jgi:hypothetical protein